MIFDLHLTDSMVLLAQLTLVLYMITVLSVYTTLLMITFSVSIHNTILVFIVNSRVLMIICDDMSAFQYSSLAIKNVKNENIKIEQFQLVI